MIETFLPFAAFNFVTVCLPVCCPRQYFIDVWAVSLLNCAIRIVLMIIDTCRFLLRLCVQWGFSHLWSTLAMGAAVYFDLYSGMCPISYRTGQTLLADQQCLLSRLAAGFG